VKLGYDKARRDACQSQIGYPKNRLIVQLGRLSGIASNYRKCGNLTAKSPLAPLFERGERGALVTSRPRNTTCAGSVLMRMKICYETVPLTGSSLRATEGSVAISAFLRVRRTVGLLQSLRSLAMTPASTEVRSCNHALLPCKTRSSVCFRDDWDGAGFLGRLAELVALLE
jgi:hypothetical protein